jgi:hypothetical protein
MAALARLLLSVLGAFTLSAPPTTAGNRVEARRDAARLLHRVVLPPGASRTSARAWRVPLSLSATIAFEKAHPPRGSRLTVESSGGGPRTPPNDELTFSFRAIPDRLSSRELDVWLVERPNGSTRLRVTAHDVAFVTRPPEEVVPPGVREIEIRSTTGVSRRVTDQRKVERIVGWFDALPVVQQLGAVFACPNMGVAPPTVTFVFRRPDGAVLARASMLDAFGGISGPCNPIRFGTEGQVKFRPLIGGRFLPRVQRLLGTSFG